MLHDKSNYDKSNSYNLVKDMLKIYQDKQIVIKV